MFQFNPYRIKYDEEFYYVLYYEDIIYKIKNNGNRNELYNFINIKKNGVG